MGNKILKLAREIMSDWKTLDDRGFLKAEPAGVKLARLVVMETQNDRINSLADKLTDAQMADFLGTQYLRESFISVLETEACLDDELARLEKIAEEN